MTTQWNRMPIKARNRSVSLDVRAASEERREATIVASTEDVDSYDEIVAQEWRLSRYLANPVVLFAHDSRRLPIGSATDVRVKNKQLLATVKFATAEENPEAELAWRLVRAGHLRGVSVGFRPGRIEEREINGQERLVLRDNDLYEISLVPIPANPAAGVTATRSAYGSRGSLIVPASRAAELTAKYERELAELESASSSRADRMSDSEYFDGVILEALDERPRASGGWDRLQKRLDEAAARTPEERACRSAAQTMLDALPKDSSFARDIEEAIEEIEGIEEQDDPLKASLRKAYGDDFVSRHFRKD